MVNYVIIFSLKMDKIRRVGKIVSWERLKMGDFAAEKIRAVRFLDFNMRWGWTRDGSRARGRDTCERSSWDVHVELMGVDQRWNGAGFVSLL